jgi:AmmeMemoRadiSam system protein B
MPEAMQPTKPLPRLRNLQFSPLKQGEDQLVMLWDATGLSQERLIIPLNYFFLVQHLDGEHSLEKLGVLYLKKFGEFLQPDKIERLVADMEAKLFLEGDKVETAKRTAVEAYRAQPIRRAVYAGRSYEADAAKLTRQLTDFERSKEGPEIKASENAGKPIKGLVVPHYELKEAGPIYAWAYKELREAAAPDLYVVLGTCHTGLSQGLAFTDKDFETPLGLVRADRPVLDEIRRQGGERFFEEDRAHQSEHTIEFQLPWLQHVVGGRNPISIVPVLCAFPPDYLVADDLRELAPQVECGIDLLKRALTSSGRSFCLVASAELAHIGMRYGDRQPPTDFAFHRCLQADLAMLKFAEDLDAKGFMEFIVKEADQRRISGFAVIYTLLRLIRADKGQVLRYDRGITDQYNSTVTFCSMSFF